MTDAQNAFSITILNVYHGRLADDLSKFVRDRMDSTSVFCFQETKREIREVFDKILIDDFVGHHATKHAEPDDLDVSTYVRREIDVLSVATICGETDGTGLALRCELVDAQGSQVTVTNVHGAFYPGNKLDTPERLQLVRRLVELARDSTDIQVIAGDFNLLPETESVQMFAANGFRNLIDEFQIPTTRNELAWQEYPSHMKQLYADYTFVRGDDVECNFSVDDVTVSDHLPMTLQILHKAAP